MNTNVTSGFLRFPGIIKKHAAGKENIFSGFTLENEDSYYFSL